MEKKKIFKKDPVFNPADLYQSALDIPESIKKEIEEKGLAARWINATEFQRQYGFHKSGWTPYKPDNKLPAIAGVSGDPEGFVRRGDLILATKTKEQHNLHKARLKMKSSMASGYNATKAKELRRFMQESGVKTKVVEGFEEPGDTDEDEE